MGRPKEKKPNKPLHAYPAPNCPEFHCACLIVEGPSDKAFFEAMLDRVEPGWRCLDCQTHDGRCAIEVRAAGGGTEVPVLYRWARLHEAEFFYTHDTLLGASAERIVVVVDADKAGLIAGLATSGKPARHRIVLTPDLERASLPAFVAALQAEIQRELTEHEQSELTDWGDILRGA